MIAIFNITVQRDHNDGWYPPEGCHQETNKTKGVRILAPAEKQCGHHHGYSDHSNKLGKRLRVHEP